MKILWVVNTGIFYATKIGKPCLIEIELRTDIKWGAQEKPCTSIKRFGGPLPTIPLGRWVNFVALAGNIGLKLTIPLNWGTFWPIDFCQKVLTLTVLMHVRYNIPCQNIYPCRCIIVQVLVFNQLFVGQMPVASPPAGMLILANGSGTTDSVWYTSWASKSGLGIGQSRGNHI